MSGDAVRSDFSSSDSTLAEKVRQRDPQALRSVVHAYLPQILRAARGAGLDAVQAEEVAQETFTTFVDAAPRFEGRSHVRTWLFGILYRKIAERRRQLDRDRRMDDIDDVFEERFNTAGRWSQPPRQPDDELYGKEARAKIENCLDAAPTQQRMAFLLREVEGLSTEEICNILGVTRTNLGVMLYRLRNRLRECLESNGIEG